MRQSRDGIGQHADRMARGRQRRAECAERDVLRMRHDAAIGAMLPSGQDWQRHAATSMLADLDRLGADEDLEALRASWRAPAAQRQTGHGFGLAPFEQSLVEPSELNLRADQAARRLRAVENLRRVVNTSPTHQLSYAPGLLSLEDSGLRPSGSSSMFLFDEAQSRSNRGRRQPKGTRWRGPLDSDSDSDEEFQCGNVLALVTMRGPSMAGPPARALRGAGFGATNDPWSAWEQNWEDAFKRMDETERSRRRVRQLEEEMRLQDEEDVCRRRWEENKARQQAESEKVRQRREERQERTAPPRRADEPADPSGSNSSASGGRSTGGTGAGSRSAPPPKDNTRSTPVAQPAPAAQRAGPALPRFAGFDAYDRAWTSFEQKISSGQGASMSCTDIPWPLTLATVSGATSQDDAAARKKKLRAALLRWHPDKCVKWLGMVRDVDRVLVTDRVKEVTRLILKEKDQFGG